MKTHNFIFSIFLIITLSISAQTFQQYNYKLVPFGGGGCVTGIITCPTQKNLIYLRTDVGGIWRWVEATKSWKSLSFKFPNPGMLTVESLAVDPSSPNRVYAIVGMNYFDWGATTLLRSTDYGENWEYIDVSTKFKSFNLGPTGESLAVDPNKGSILYYGTRNNGLWKSTDYGTNWNQVTTFPITSSITGPGITFVEFIPEFTTKGEETQALYVGLTRSDNKLPIDSSNIYLTVDYGKSWSPISSMKGNGFVSPPANYSPLQTVYAGGKIYVTYGNIAKSAVWRYDVLEERWEDVSPSDVVPISGISVDNTTNPTYIALTTNTIGWTQTWIPGVTTYGDDFFRGKFDMSGKITWDKKLIGASLAKYDMNAQFINGNLHWAWDIAIDPFNPNRVFSTSGIGVYTSDNFTNNISLWYHNVRGLEETVTMDAVSKPGGEFLYAIGDASGGTYTDPTKYGIRFNPLQAVTSSVDYAVTAPTLIRAGSDRVASDISSPVMYSNDGGKTWIGLPFDKMPLDPVKSNTFTADSIKPVYGRLAITSDAKIIAWSPRYWIVNGVKYYGNFYTADYGKSWVEFPGSIKAASFIYADKVNPNVIYICTGTNIYVYTWNGTTFDYKSYTPPSTLNKVIKVNPFVEGEFLAYGLSGIYLYKSKGQQFTQLPNLHHCTGASFGKPAPDSTYPTIFVFGNYGSESIARIFRSDDAGKTWIRINDENSSFGGLLSMQVLVGDMNTYGRVYFATGIGLHYGDIDNSVYTKSLTVTGKNGATAVLSSAGTLQMTAQFNPANTTTQKLNWYVDNTSLATIDTLGVLTGKKAGTVTVTATAMDGTGVFGICKITVADKLNAVNDIQVNPLAKVYPNPFVNSAIITTDKILNYKILSVNGMVVETGEIAGFAHIGTKLTNGIYLLELTDKLSGTKQTSKLVKRNN